MSATPSNEIKDRQFLRLYVENWRNFLRIEDIALQNRVFLVGPNASGKSHFLDIFRFLSDIVSVGGGFQEAVRRRGGVSRLRCLAARQNPDIVIRVEVGGNHEARSSYELHFGDDAKRPPLIKSEKVVKNGVELFVRPDSDDQNDPERLTQTYLEQVNVNKRFRYIANFLASVRYLHVVPQLVREPDRSVGKKNDPYGGDFLEQIARTSEGTRKARLRQIQKALRVAVPQLSEIELHKDERGTPHLRGKYEHWRPQGAWQTEDQFSDGTLRLMGLLWAALDGDGPLLLEEPELSLHPEVVRFIPQLFARIQRKFQRQVFISTHSSDILRDEGIGLDEVLLLQPGENGTRVRLAESLQEVKRLLESGIGLAEAIIPQTRPQQAEQLTLFADL